jgi:hypothetical protein
MAGKVETWIRDRVLGKDRGGLSDEEIRRGTEKQDGDRR